MRRDGYIPEIVEFEFTGTTPETDAFNGEYYGVWIVDPIPPVAMHIPDCTSLAPGGTVDRSPEGRFGPSPTAAPIELEVFFDCPGAI